MATPLQHAQCCRAGWYTALCDVKQYDLWMFEAEFVSKDSDQTETAPNGEHAPMVYPGKEERGRFKASDCVEAAACMRVTARYSSAADDLRLAGEMLAQARTKQLPST